MCEEEDSSMDEDEDMPGLESVSSSEVRGQCGDMVCSLSHLKSGRSRATLHVRRCWGGLGVLMHLVAMATRGGTSGVQCGVGLLP